MKKSIEKMKKTLQKSKPSKPVTPKTEPSDFELEIEVNRAELEIGDINRALDDEQVVHVDALYSHKFTLTTTFLLSVSYTFFFRPPGNLPRISTIQGQLTVRTSLLLGIFLVPLLFFMNISIAKISFTGYYSFVRHHIIHEDLQYQEHFHLHRIITSGHPRTQHQLKSFFHQEIQLS